MPVRRVGVVEDVDRQVEHAVRRVLVLEYHFIHRPLVELALEGGRGDEVVVVEIALGNREEVSYKQQTNQHRSKGAARKGGFLAAFPAAPEDYQIGKGDEDERTQGVHTQQVGPVGGECADEDVRHTAVGLARETAGDAREQAHKQAEASADGKRNPTLAAEGFGEGFFPDYLVEYLEGEYRQGELQHDQRHRHRPELIVERDEVVEELGEGEEMVANCEQHGKQAHRDYPPLVPAAAQNQTEQEEEDGDSAYVHRAGGKRLRAPIERQVLADLAGITLAGLTQELVGFRVIRVDRAARRAAVEVRNHQVRQLLPSVGPGGRVVELQALGAVAARLGGAAAAHRIRGVLHCRQELDGVGRDSGAAQHEQQARSGKEAADHRPPVLGNQQPYQQGKGVEQEHYRQIVGDLGVVGLDLKAYGQAEKGRTEQALAEEFLFI